MKARQFMKKWFAWSCRHYLIRQGNGFMAKRTCRSSLYPMIVLAVGVLCAAPCLYAASPTVSKRRLPVNNIGFMKHPPEAWVKKFPMCDAFLKVKWIDVNKEVGYSVYDIYVNGKKYGPPRAALVFITHLDPHYDYDVNEWREKGKLKELFSNVRNSKDITGYLSDDTRLLYALNPNGASPDYSLADHRENVCVPYPPGRTTGYWRGYVPKGANVNPASGVQRMWLAEIKQAGKIYSKHKLEEVYKKIKSLMTPNPNGILGKYDGLKDFNAYDAIDFNADGIDDYYSGSNALGNTVYSYGNRYYKLRSIDDRSSVPDATFGEYEFPPSNNTCYLGLRRNFYLTTDGKDYYLNNSCNITALTGKR